MAFDFGFSNILEDTLQADAASGDTALSVTSGMASDVDSLLAQSDVSRVVLVIAETANLIPGDRYEIVYATGADTTNDTITVSRGQDGTSAQSWSSGHVLANRLTRGTLDELRAALGGGSSPFADYGPEFLYVGELDLTDGTAEVSVEQPTGYRFWATQIHLVPVSISSPGNDGQVAWGTTSGGTEISDAFIYTLGANQRDFYYADDETLSYESETFYVHVPAADTGSTVRVNVYILGEWETL